MVRRRWMRPVVAGALLLLGAGGATAQRSGSPASPSLQTVERGQWLLRDGEGKERKLCVTNPAMLLQIYHGGAQCQQFVVENRANGSTVRYTCPGHGAGRTSITVETPRLVSLDTQGVADGSPFSEQMEGRRVGECGR